ncbi:MAG: MHYT domain-containing protein, partial [Novosphingobium sp.]
KRMQTAAGVLMLLEFLLCFHEEHDLRLVFLAAVVCLLSANIAVLAVRQAGSSRSHGARIGTMAGSLAAVSGLWGAYFIALLGYNRNLVAGSGAVLTAGSLAMALASAAAVFRIVRSSRARHRPIYAAAVAAIGLAAMHYAGAASLDVTGPAHWHPLTELLSLAVMAVPLYPALLLTVRGQGWATGTLLTCSVSQGIFQACWQCMLYRRRRARR